MVATGLVGAGPPGSAEPAEAGTAMPWRLSHSAASVTGDADLEAATR